MRLSIRTCLIWLLMLALPAQALAAATMAFCGPSHHAAPSAWVHQASEPAHHGQPAGSAQEAKHQQGVDTLATDEAADPVAVAAPADEAAMQKCSACASCCSAAALPNPVSLLPAPFAADAVHAALAPAIDPFAVGGPDRPPRMLPA